MVDNENTTPLRVSAIRYATPASKRYALQKGELIKKTLSRDAEAIAVHKEFKTFGTFAEWRKELDPRDVILAGTWSSPEVDGKPVYHQHALQDDGAAANNDHLAMRSQPGLMIIDFDVKCIEETAGLYPDNPPQFETLEDFVTALVVVLPEAEGCALYVTDSTSAMIYETKTGKRLKGPGGIRTYLPVTDASKIPALMDLLVKRSWLNGYGWAFISRGGSFLERGLIDMALARPAQPDFAAVDLGKGLEQRKRELYFEGDWLDPASVTPLSTVDAAEYRLLLDKAKGSLAGAQKTQKQKCLEEKVEQLVEQGVDKKRARKIAKNLLESGVVCGADVVVFEDGTKVTAAELVVNGEQYGGRLCLDPVEPDYDGGRVVGKFYWNDGDRPGINSMAHGGRWYHVRHDLESLKGIIEDGDKDEIVVAMARAELDGIDENDAEKTAAKALGMGRTLRPLREAVSTEKNRIEPTPRPNDTGEIIADQDAPLDTANSMVSRYYTAQNARTLHFQNGDFYTWNGCYFLNMDNDTARAHIYSHLGQADTPYGDPFNPTASDVSNVIDALRAVCNVPEIIKPPSWYGGGDVTFPADELVACRNGLIHIPTRSLISPTPYFFTRNALTFEFDPDAPEPERWLKFLDDQWSDDQESIDTLQEMIGYLLGLDTSQQKIFLIVGPKRSGKGTAGRVITRLIGEDNVANPTLGSLSKQFGLEPLIDKQLAIIADARLGGQADQNQIAERLLSISGEDGQTIDRKHRRAWFGTLSARFLVLSNELPRIVDASGALASRFIILRMTKTFFGKEDVGLTKKLEEELPGILNWALNGWERLRERGYFIQPASAKEDIEALEDLTSPIGAFLRDMCDVGEGFEVSVAELYKHWVSWCRSEGRNYPGTKQTFGRDLKAALPQVKTAQRRVGEARKPERFYLGVQLNTTTCDCDLDFDKAVLSRSVTRNGSLWGR